MHSTENPNLLHEVVLKSALLDTIDLAILSIDLHHRITSSNQYTEKIFGFEKDQMLGLLLSDAIIEFDHELDFQLREKFRKNKEEEPFTTIGKNKKTGLFSVVIKLLDLKNDEGELIGTAVICKASNVYGRSKPDLELINKRLLLHHENTPLGVIEWTSNMKILSWSPMAEEIFEWKAKEVVGKQLNEIQIDYLPDRKKVTREVISLLKGTKEKSVSFNRNKTKSGSVITCEWYNSVLKDESGKVTSILSFVLDITEKARGEKALRRSEFNLKQAQELSQLGSWEWDAGTNEVFWSEQFYKVLGRDHSFTLDDSPSVYKPEDWARRLEATNKTINDGTPFSLEFNITCPNGETRWIELRGARTFSEVPGHYKLYGTVQNITDRVLDRQCLEDSRNNMSIVLEGMRDAIILLDKDFKILLCNELAKEIIKARYPDAKIEVGEFFNKQIPRAFEQRLQQFHEHQSEKKPFNVVMETYSRTGEKREWLASTFPIYGINNQISHIAIRISNLDEEKKLQQERDFEILHKNALINSTEDFIWSYDRNFHLLSANKAFLNIYYLSDNRIIKPGELIDFVSPFQPAWKEQSLRAFAGESFTVEVQTLILAIEKVMYLEVSFNPIIEKESVIGATCFVRVINERKAQENKLRETTYFLHRAQEVAQVGHWIYRPNSPHLPMDCSPETAKILGNTSYEGISSLEQHAKRLHPDERDTVMKLLANAKEDGISFRTEARILMTPSNEYKWIELSAERYTDENTKEPSLLGVIKDIDQRVKSRIEIESLNADLEKMVALRTTELQNAVFELESFSYSVSHDLRAPLRGIHGYANLITEDFGKTLDPEVIRLLDAMKGNARQMGQLIDDLLDFSRLGKKPVTKGNVNPLPILEKIIAESKTTFSSHAEFEIGYLHPMLADKSLISVVFANIISNAIKYSSKKEHALIKISSEVKDDMVVYHIQDNGAGFDMAYYKKLFGVFQRLHSHQEFSGTGVGLAIVEKIIKKHGGKIWAEGVVGEGATFHFSLPKKDSSALLKSA